MKKRFEIILSMILIMIFISTSAGFTATSVKSIKLSNNKITMEIGQSYTLKVTITPANASNKNLAFSTSNSKIATVDKNGKITAVKEGNAVITVASSSDKKISAKCSVTVSKKTKANNFGPLSKYDPPITLTTVSFDSIAVNWVKKVNEDDSMGNSPWTKLYKDVLGIKIDMWWTAGNGEQLTSKTNLMIASGNIPDFFSVDTSQYKQLVEAGLLASMEEALARYPSATFRKMMDIAGPIPMQITRETGGGTAYGVPVLPGPEGMPAITWINDTWMKKLGLQAPKDLDGLMDIARAFAKNDPDGNGKDDTYGIPCDKNMDYYVVGGFFNMNHSYPGYWVKNAKGDALAYGSILPQTRDTLLKLQKLYKEGVIDPEFGVKEYAEVVIQDMQTAKVGILPAGLNWHGYSAMQKDLKNDWKPYKMVSVDDKPALPALDAGVGGYWVASKKCRHPEAVVKMLNLWYKIMYETTSKEDNEKKIWETYISNDKAGGVHNYCLVKQWAPVDHLSNNEGLKKVFAGQIKPEQLLAKTKAHYEKFLKAKAGDRTERGMYVFYGAGSATDILEYYINNKLIQYNEYYGPTTKTMADRMSQLKDKEREVFVKIIMGDPIEKFDQFVQDWKKSGGDTITKEVNEWYKNKK